MPFDANGNASVTRNIAVTGQTVLAEQVNVPFADIQSMLSQVLLRSGVAPMTGALNMNGFKVTGAEDGVAATDLVTVGQLQTTTPIGALIDFAGSTAPAGWLLCYGQAISRSENSALFAVIGTAYGEGDGTTTFNLPDLRGRIVAGKDNMGGTSSNRLSTFFGALATTVGGVLGAASKSLSVSEMPAHNHGGQTSGGVDTVPTTLTDLLKNLSGSLSLPGGGAVGIANVNVPMANHYHTIPSQGSGTAFGIAQPTIIMNKIIKVY